MYQFVVSCCVTLIYKKNIACTPIMTHIGYQNFANNVSGNCLPSDGTMPLNLWPLGDLNCKKWVVLKLNLLLSDFYYDNSALALVAWQQAIAWAQVDPDLCRHMASLSHSMLTYPKLIRTKGQLMAFK